jgi:hypothetical protein
VIVFDLQCRDGGHRFEGWFSSSEDFAEQHERGLLSCPQCGAGDIAKAPMAPNLGRKENQVSPVRPPRDTASPGTGTGAVAGPGLPPQAVAMLQAVAAMQAAALRDSRWVGDAFAEISREIHYGERDAEAIHGEATVREALDLLEEGIEVTPLPFPVAPPGKSN